MVTFALLDLGTADLAIILLIVLLLFGGKKLPELANSFGRSAKELKKGLGDVHDLRDEAKSQVGQIKQSWNGSEQKSESQHTEA
ncbi:MAG TPA: twin-arginine translocase TatA/TatE family subunit [Candidatus Saccharimonadales bacterium]